MFNKKKRIDERIGKYPSNDHLNNALRFLIGTENIKSGIYEIVYAINEADGYICDDVKIKLMEYDDSFKRFFN